MSQVLQLELFEEFLNLDSFSHFHYSSPPQQNQDQYKDQELQELEFVLDMSLKHNEKNIEYNESMVEDSTKNYCEDPYPQQAPKRRKRKPCHVETKNLCKFFGSRLFIFLKENLLKSEDLSLLNNNNCQTIKSMKSLWIASQNIRDLSRVYFRSQLPVIAIMESDRIIEPKVALRFIPSFIQGIEYPNLFKNLKWN